MARGSFAGTRSSRSTGMVATLSRWARLWPSGCELGRWNLRHTAAAPGAGGLVV